MEDEGGCAGVEVTGESVLLFSFDGFLFFEEAEGEEVGFCGTGGEAFVDGVDGEVKFFLNSIDEGIDFFGFESDGAVHVVGVADDDGVDAAFFDDSCDVVEAFVEGFLDSSFDGSGDAEVGIAYGKADAFFTVVDA